MLFLSIEKATWHLFGIRGRDDATILVDQEDVPDHGLLRSHVLFPFSVVHHEFQHPTGKFEPLHPVV